MSASDGGAQQTGPGVITSPSMDTRTLSHTGAEVGSANVTLSQNTTGSNTEVARWTVPKKYVEMVFSGGKHVTRAEVRTLETITGTTGDDTVVSLSTNIVPIAGEATVADQPFPVAVAYNTDTSTQYTVTVADGGYAANEITLGTNPADTETVKIWPIMADGTVQYRGIDAFGHQVGPLDEWGVPTHVFADFEQDDNRTQIHMIGAGSFEKEEELALYMDSPDQIVWTDADYPNGEYVSQWEQRVDVQV